MDFCFPEQLSTACGPQLYAGLRLGKWFKMPSVDGGEVKGKLTAACQTK